MSIKKICFAIILCLLLVLPPITINVGASTDPYLTVLQPNGGEKWGANENHIIAWASSNLNTQGRIFIYVGNDNNWKKIAGPIPTDINAWTWNIKDVPFTHAKIKVVNYVNGNEEILDTSDGQVTFLGSTPKLEPPAHISPLNNSINVPIKPTFKWNKINAAYSYRIQISRFQSFSKIYIDRWIIGKEYFTPELSLPGNSVLYWRVASYDSAGTPSLWSYPWVFDTGKSDNANYFTASGRLTNSDGFPIMGATIDFICENSNSITPPTTVVSDSMGYWSQTGFKAGYKYRVIPEKPAYSFSPMVQFVELWNSTNIDFEGTSGFTGGLTVAYPNGTESIEANKSHLITWTSAELDPDSYIYIYLKKSIGETELIGGPISPSVMSYNWYAPNFEIEMAKIQIVAKNGTQVTASDESDWWFKITKEEAIPQRPTLVSPINGEKWVSTYPRLSWKEVPTYDTYQVQLSDDQYFTNLILERYVPVTWVEVTPALMHGRKYYWRVKAFNNSTNDTTEWSYWNTFETGYERENTQWMASGYVRDENGNGIYGCMISFVAADNYSEVPAVAVTNKDGYWSQTGFAEDVEYYVYPAISGATFTPTYRTIKQGVMASTDFIAYGLGSVSQVSVRSPTEGNYPRGGTLSIAWSVTSIPDDAVFYISLLHDGKVTSIDGPLPSTDRHHVWVIPDIITSDAKIRVQAWKNSQIIAEAKSATFAITGP